MSGIERRRAPRIACCIPAAGPAGRADIEDLSALGARVRASAPARPGDRVHLTLHEADGRSVRLIGTVRRARGSELGCSFESDPASALAAWRLAQRVAKGGCEFVTPPAPRKSAGHGWSVGDFSGARAGLLLAVGLALLLCGCVVMICASLA